MRRKKRRKSNRILIVAVSLLVAVGTLYYCITGQTAVQFHVGRKAAPYAFTGMEVHFLDVGQGDSILVLQGETAVLIDGGEVAYGQRVVDYLLAHGVDEIDLLIPTHRHTDHIGGLLEVLDSYTVSSVLLSEPDEAFAEDSMVSVLFDEALARNGASVYSAVPGNAYEYGDMLLTCVSPHTAKAEANTLSVVVRVEYGETSFLFTGDADDAAEETMLQADMPLSCNVLKVGHHGSATSTTPAFLQAVSPAISVISCGEDNDYGHPAPQTLERLQSAGNTIYRTDLDGTVVLVSDGQTVYRK